MTESMEMLDSLNRVGDELEKIRKILNKKTGINFTDKEVAQLCKEYEAKIKFLEEVIAHTQKTGSEKHEKY